MKAIVTVDKGVMSLFDDEDVLRLSDLQLVARGYKQTENKTKDSEVGRIIIVGDPWEGIVDIPEVRLKGLIPHYERRINVSYSALAPEDLESELCQMVQRNPVDLTWVIAEDNRVAERSRVGLQRAGYEIVP